MPEAGRMTWTRAEANETGKGACDYLSRLEAIDGAMLSAESL